MPCFKSRRVHVAFDPTGELRERLLQLPETAIVNHGPERPNERLIRRVAGLSYACETVVLLFRCGECKGSDFWLSRPGVRELPEGAFA